MLITLCKWSKLWLFK